MTGMVSVVQPDPGSPEQQSLGETVDTHAIAVCASPNKLAHSSRMAGRRRVIHFIIGCPRPDLTR